MANEQTLKDLQDQLTRLEYQLKELNYRVKILETKTPHKSFGGPDPKLMTTQVPGRYDK